MKIFTVGIMAFVGCLFVYSGIATAQENKHCKAKEERLLKEIKSAKQYNANKVEGLERALENVRAWCTDDGLRQEAKTKITEKQEKVTNCEASLAEAEREEKSQEKIEKLRHKLSEAKDELHEAQEEFNALQ